MNYLKIGKYVATHGLKGEIKIISEKNNKTFFNIGNIIYIGESKKPFQIKTYRKHQKYDMITLDSLDSIDKVLPLKGENIFVNKDDIVEPLIEDVLNYDVYNNGVYIGKVIELLKGIKYDYIVVSDNRIIIPYIDNFIVLVDNENKVIKTQYII